MIPYGKQQITEEDIGAVVEALKSDFLTQGPRIHEFEKSFGKYVGSEYAVAVANGTAALHLCAMALGVEPGKKVITTPITFAASANCIRYCGGEIVFADIDPSTYLIDLESVKSILVESDGHIAGIIPVDFAGRAVDLEKLKKMAAEHQVWIIEDACHAPGGFFRDSTGMEQRCGNGLFADLAIFSFHPVKHIAAGEGGMITTNDKNLYNKIVRLRTHGITRDSNLFQNTQEWASSSETTKSDNWPGWYMEMLELGYNYRLTDIQCALGKSQLNRADVGLEKRKVIAVRYRDELSNISAIKGSSGVVEGHAYHLYVIEVEDRLDLYNFLRERKIFTQVHYIPVHMMPYYQQLGWKEGDLPNAENYYRNCLSLPMYPTLTKEEQTYVINTIKEFYHG